MLFKVDASSYLAILCAAGIFFDGKNNVIIFLHQQVIRTDAFNLFCLYITNLSA